MFIKSGGMYLYRKNWNVEKLVFLGFSAAHCWAQRRLYMVFENHRDSAGI